MNALVGRVICFVVRRHRWQRKSVRQPGLITMAPACTRCGTVDWTRAEQRVFNRAGRRETKRTAARAVRAHRR